MVDEVDFLPVDKYESFLQVDSITLVVRCQLSTDPKTLSLQYLFNASRKV